MNIENNKSFILHAFFQGKSLQNGTRGDSNIVTLSESISRSARLELLDIDNCKKLQEIPRVPQSMGMVDARNCIGLDPKTSSRLLNQIRVSSSMLSFKGSPYRMAPEPDNFQVLEFLLLGDSNIVTLSESISRSARLELLDIDNCNQLQEIPRVPQSMGMVDARSCIGL
ncbi:TMV resistance protein N-like [Quercus suber]|uniref:TMV resistance protein N-like n=1 Tax=Quercus suber TaxID=58331 RepID=UPI0032DED2CF